MKRFSAVTLLTTLLLLVSMVCSAQSSAGENTERFRRFQRLLESGSPSEFYEYVKGYQQYLQDENLMEAYYKTKCNEGFYALRHHHLYHAMQVAKKLDNDVREAGAHDYFYLPTGLIGEIYYNCHNMRKAEHYFLRALEEVGGRDPKYTMLIYMNLAKMTGLKNQPKALEWAERSLSLARETQNAEFISMSLGVKAYVLLIEGNGRLFSEVYDEYRELGRRESLQVSPLYDNLMDVGRKAFSRDYAKALAGVRRGGLNVDSSLLVVRIHEMAGDIRQGFAAMSRRNAEMDSIYSLTEDAHFDGMMMERDLMKIREEWETNRLTLRRMNYLMVGMAVAFLLFCLFGGRWLMRKVWARNKHLNIALIKAEKGNRLHSAFIRKLGQELHDSLRGLEDCLQPLRRPDWPVEGQEELWNAASRHIALMAGMGEEAVELTRHRGDAALDEVEKTDVRCNALCRSVMELMKGKQHAGVELRFSSNVDDDFVLRTHPHRLLRALVHLMDNALKFTEHIGYVDLRCEYRDGQVQFAVQDTGVGIKAKNRDCIFDVFARIDDFKEGAGLGLPVCRRLVMSLGGTVELDPGYDSGCRFVITLPVAAAS